MGIWFSFEEGTTLFLVRALPRPCAQPGFSRNTPSRKQTLAFPRVLSSCPQWTPVAHKCLPINDFVGQVPFRPSATTARSAPDLREARPQDLAQLLEGGLLDLQEAIAAQSAVTFEFDVGAVEIGSTTGWALLRIGVGIVPVGRPWARIRPVVLVGDQ